MEVVHEKPRSLNDRPFIYCPGCHHGIIHRLVAQTIDELGIQDRSVCVSSIGCSVRIWRFLEVDVCQSAHGRGLAVATGIKRCAPDNVVFTYQGDGDLVAIGMGETVHAAARGENITTIFVNNAVFGATGGQQAPTTLIGQQTTTSPWGRKAEVGGYPIRMAEMLAGLDGTAYVARAAVNSPRNVIRAQQMVRRAFEAQLEGHGFSLLEFVAACPTNLKLNPMDSMKWVDDNMIPYYPLGELKTPWEAS